MLENFKYFSFSKINELALLGFIFVLPIHMKIAVYFLFFFGLTFLFNASFSLFKENIFKYKFLLLFPFIYLLYLLQAISDQYFVELGLKLSFVVFPLFFLSSKINWIEIKEKILKTYLFGCLLSVLLNFVIAFYRYDETNNLDVFFYTFFSSFMHAGYYAFHLTFAFAVCLNILLFDKNKSWISVFMFSLTLFFLVAGIVLLSSKGALFALILIFFSFQFQYIALTKKWEPFVLSIMVFVFMIFLSFENLYFFNQRIDNFLTAFDEKPIVYDTSSSRELIWERAVELIKEKPLWGYGNDANQQLVNSYLKHNMIIEYDHQLNAHNEFLQLFLELGILGLLALLILLGKSIVDFMKTKDMLYFSFIIIALINLIIESTFETETGIVFFCFFYCFFTAMSSAKNDSRIAQIVGSNTAISKY